MLYSGASEALKAFAERFGIPVAETQAGQSSLPAAHALNMGAIGVTGTSASNVLAEQADVILAVGSRLQDFTTGSWAAVQQRAVDGDRLEHAGVRRPQASRSRSSPTPAPASRTSPPISAAGTRAGELDSEGRKGRPHGLGAAMPTRRRSPAMRCSPPTARVIGAVQRVIGSEATLVCASGGLAGRAAQALQAGAPGSYHLDYGYLDHGLRDRRRPRH